MSVLQEYNNAADLLTEIFRVTRDHILISNSEIYNMKNRLKGHVEDMIRSQIGDRNMGERIVLRIGCDTSSAKEHYDYSLQALDDLYVLIHDLTPLDHEIKFLKAKIVSHMERFINNHLMEHEDNYNETAYLPENMRIL